MLMAGTLSRHRLKPAIRMEVSSLSAAKRPYTKSTAVKKPHGTVKVRENGITCNMKSITIETGAPLSTSKLCNSLNNCPSSMSSVSDNTPKKVTNMSCFSM